MNRRHDWKITLYSLACLAAIVLLGKSYDSTLPASDAATHAALAMSATAQGLIPHFPIGADAFGGHWGAGYNDYPFAFFYLNGWIMRFFGPTAWSAKLLPCLFSVGTVVLTAVLGMRWQSRLAGVFAGLILLFTRDFILDAVNCHLDNTLAFFILLSILFWERKEYLWAGVAAGVGTWFKSPVAFLIFPVIFLSSAIRGEWREIAWPLARSLVLSLVVSSLIWILPGIYGNWDLVRDYWVRQVWGTAFHGRGEQSLDVFAFFRILHERYLPWTAFLAWGIYFTAYRRQWRRPSVLIPYLSAGIVIAMISLVRYKHDHYFTPAYPFLSIVAARPGAALLARFEYAATRALSLAALGLGVLLLCTPLELSPESFPALKRFMAIIETEGDAECSKSVLFVDGGQPYGGPRDYKNLVNFYTGRQMDAADCAGTPEQASRPEVGWIIVSRENLEKCLTPAERALYPQSFQYGDQFLLSRRAPGSPTVDLSGLSRELSAVTDCRPAPLPHNRYVHF